MSRYLHIGRGLYYGSYRAPRTLVWAIGTVILILMMAIFCWFLVDLVYSPSLWHMQEGYIINVAMVGTKAGRIKAINRVGPHNKEILSIIIGGMLGDFWADKISGKTLPSIRFQIEQSILNGGYIAFLAQVFYNNGYCSNDNPKLVKKHEGIDDKRTDKTVIRHNFRLTLFTFTSLNWIYEGFYKELNGKKVKVVPKWITEYLTPCALAHWVMQDGHRTSHGISLASNSFSYDDVVFLVQTLHQLYGLSASIHTFKEGTYTIYIGKKDFLVIRDLIKPYIVPEMEYKIRKEYK